MAYTGLLFQLFSKKQPTFFLVSYLESSGNLLFQERSKTRLFTLLIASYNTLPTTVTKEVFQVPQTDHF